jgi:GNAT superfamily N-acetyltransferase
MDVLIRRLVGSDAGAYRELLEGATEEERYFRFFRPVREVDETLVDPFVTVTGDMLALIAEEPSGRPLGAAHAFLEDAGRRAELSVLVAHEAHHQGIGTRLIRKLIEQLRAQGCITLVANSLDANGSFSHLARGLGMSIRSHDIGTLTWELPLAPIAPPTLAAVKAVRAAALAVVPSNAASTGARLGATAVG